MYKDGFKPVISIVIPVHNQMEKTIACLKSIRANTKMPYEVIWVDNGSNPEQFGQIRKQAIRPRVHCKLVKNAVNIGFVKATNQGILEAEGDFVILLNNDTEVTWKWESKLIKPMINDPKVGAVGPITQSKLAWQESANLNRRWNLGLPIYDAAIKDKYLEILFSKFGDKYIDIENLPLSFFCAAFRRDVFKTVGLLEEKFNIGLGDDDEYCFRLRAYGYHLMLSLGTFIYHWHRTTFNSLNYGVDSIRRHNIKVLKAKEKEITEKIKSGEIKPHFEV